MNYTIEDAEVALRVAEKCMNLSDFPPERMKKLWMGLLIVRGRSLVRDLCKLTGDKVYGGPFKGMALTSSALITYQAPVLLGCYEHELHSVFAKVIAGNYTRILNIGCSVGYYAVGLARSMPQVQVDAFDIDPEARKKCEEMVQVNGVADRVRVSGEFLGDNFANYAEEKTLVLMDIEGAELDLLDPVRYPALQKMDAIVEMHDVVEPSLSKTICARFASSHSVETIANETAYFPDVHALLPSAALDPFDHLLLGWERREGPTPWGVFRSKASA